MTMAQLMALFDAAAGKKESEPEGNVADMLFFGAGRYAS